MSDPLTDTLKGREFSRRELLRMLGATAGVVVLGACGAPSGSTTTAGGRASTSVSGSAGLTAPSSLQSSLSVLHTGYEDPNWGHRVADIVAWEKGYLQEVGFTEYDELVIGDSLETVLGGGVEWTAADTDGVVIAAVEHDQDAVWLACMRDKEDLLFGLAPGVRLEDLDESSAVSGGEIGTRGELQAMKMLEELGIPRDGVQWITLGGGSDTRIAALISGDLMGSALRPRHIAPLEEAGGTVVYNERQTVAQEGYVTTRTFYEENRDAVTAYLYAIIKAKQYLTDLSRKEEVIDYVVARDFEMPPEFRDAYDETISNHSPDGGFEISEMDLIFDEMAESGEIASGIDWRAAVDLGALWDAQDALGLPRRPETL